MVMLHGVASVAAKVSLISKLLMDAVAAQIAPFKMLRATTATIRYDILNMPRELQIGISF